MKRQKLALILLVWLAAAPVFAGTVYVPYAAGFELGGVQYRTWVWASNNFPDISAVAEHFFIPTFKDGTLRDGEEPKRVWMVPGETRVFEVGAGQKGMLEVNASSEVYIHARLVPVGEDPASGQGIDLPVISSDNVVAAGETAQLLGMERGKAGTTSFTNFGFVNIGHQATACLVNVFRADGVQMVTDFPLEANPLSHTQFQNVLSILGQTEVRNWRLALTCDQPFFPYLSINYPETGRITFIGPSASGKSELAVPTDGPSDQFEYLSDLPIDRWGGIELRPFVDSTGINFHGGSGSTVLGGFAKISIQGTTYDKGISFYGKWSQTPFVEFKLDGKYARFTAVVRLDDYARNRYEWAVVEGGRWRRLERPSDGFRGRERSNPIRVGGAATFRVLGDGVTLFDGPEVHAHRDGVLVDIDVTGVKTLRLQTSHGGHETLDAPYRNGLSSQRLVSNCPWWDLISFADTKLFLP